jgi:hypothetical protein
MRADSAAAVRRLESARSARNPGRCCRRRLRVGEVGVAGVATLRARVRLSARCMGWWVAGTSMLRLAVTKPARPVENPHVAGGPRTVVRPSAGPPPPHGEELFSGTEDSSPARRTLLRHGGLFSGTEDSSPLGGGSPAEGCASVRSSAAAPGPAPSELTPKKPRMGVMRGFFGVSP